MSNNNKDVSPDFMPVLSGGGHHSPKDGACIMELASFLAGEKWTDRPDCVNSMLALAARCVNDTVSSAARQRLLPLLPRLMGTGGIDLEVNRKLAEYVDPGTYYTCPQYAISKATGKLASRLKRDEVSPKFPEEVSPTLLEDVSNDLIDFLTGLIDEYYRITGRTETIEITPEDYARMAELTGVSA